MNALTLFVTICAAWLGFALGVAVGRWQAERERRTTGRPMRLVARDYTAPILPAQAGSVLSQWELYAVSFAFHGNHTGFSYRRMRDAGLCRRAAWETYTELLSGAGVIRTEARSVSGWAGGWNYPGFRAAVKNGRLSLPFPAGDPPPLNSAHVAAQIAQHSTGNTGGTA